MLAARADHHEACAADEHARASIANVGDQGAVGREAGGLNPPSRGVHRDKRRLLAGGEVDGLDGFADDACAADESEMRSVRGPGGLELIGFAAGDLLDGTAGEVERPDVVAALEGAVRGKGDAVAIGRDTRLAVVAVAGGDLLQAGAVGAHGPDVEGSAGVGLDRDEAALGRPVRVRGLVVRRGDLLRRAASDGQRVEQALHIHDERLVVGRGGHGHVRALRDGDHLYFFRELYRSGGRLRKGFRLGLSTGVEGDGERCGKGEKDATVQPG